MNIFRLCSILGILTCFLTSEGTANSIYNMEVAPQLKEDTPKKDEDTCSGIQPEKRIDCYPEEGASQAGCQARGCCWALAPAKYIHAPCCFYPPGFSSYSIANVTKTGNGYSFNAVRSQQTCRPHDLMKLSGSLQFYQGGIARLRVCFYIFFY